MKLIHHEIKTVVKNFGKQESGLSTGISAIDKPIRGLRSGNLILIAGRPSQGKSSLMMDMALHIGKTSPVLVCSLEMPFSELQERSVCNIARLNYHRILSGMIDRDDRKRLESASTDLENRSVYVVDGQWVVYPEWFKDRATDVRPANSLLQLIREAVNQYGIKIVFIDHLQLVGAEGFKVDNESLRLHKITEALHYLTIELGIPIVLLSQLRRMDQERKKESTVPSMDDIRNSGQVEEDCNIILMIHRPDYYAKKEEIDLYSNLTETNVEIIIDKNRGGPTGKVLIQFAKYCMSFSDSGKQEDLLGDL